MSDAPQMSGLPGADPRLDAACELIERARASGSGTVAPGSSASANAPDNA